MLRFPGIFKPRPPQPPDRELQQAIELGHEARLFVSGALFKHICEEAESKVIAAQNALCKVNPTDVEKIIELQAVVARFDHFVSSLSDMIIAGDSALNLAKARETND